MIFLRKAILAAIFVIALSLNGFSQQPAPAAKPCSEPEQKQFDFWVGEWDLTTPGQAGGGVNRIQRGFDGCVIQENFTGAPPAPLIGMSVSAYDPIAKKWKQTWVDNQGAYLDFVGEFKDGEMVLQREAVKKDGARFLQRMVWKNIATNELDWSWESSTDQGKTWKVVWPVHYKRKS